MGSPLSIGLDISALDPSFKAHSGRGIGRYVAELKNFFSKIDREDLDIGFFTQKDLVERSPLSGILNFLPLGKVTFRQQALLPIAMASNSLCPFDVLHFPAHMDPPAWSKKPYIVTVLDLIPLVMADLYKAANPNWRYHIARKLEIQAIKNASLILAISKNTASDVEHVLGIDPDLIKVTYLGVDEKFFGSTTTEEEENYIRDKYRIPPKCDLVLYVGGIDPRKNVRGLLEPLSFLIRDTERDIRLFMAGSIEEDRQYPALLKMIKELGLNDRVILGGFVPDSDLIKIFQISAVFLFPSLYEGFGLPPLEAMASGLPVVSSNRSCLPEVLGDAAIFVDPEDSEGIAKAVLEVIRDKDLSLSLKERGRKQARLYSWEKTGEATLNAYLRVAGVI
ncbi:MAG: glycosyltransferase family 1 protein [Candidatus Dadabacteria bacterium]|nr:MAG: glycosyltransferase family 1 protein [Candidatus Dadabacteria bacterium]